MARKSSSEQQLSLFSGPHLTDVAFREALARDDLEAAATLAPAIWKPPTAALAHAVRAQTPEARVQALTAVAHGLPPLLLASWHRLVAQALELHTPVGVLDGKPAGWYWLQGERPDLARRALERHLGVQPADFEAWALLAQWHPLRAAARCAFHGGPVLAAAQELADVIAAEDLPVGPWLLTFAWLRGAVTLAEVADAVQVAGLHRNLPAPLPNDGHAFAAWLLVAEREPQDVRVRRNLQRIHAPTFQRWLARRGA